MKVAHLIDSGGLYGAEQVLLTLCKEQHLQGLQPIIVSCGLPNEPEKAIEKVSVGDDSVEYLIKEALKIL